jgi:hypothetical protein
MVGFGSQKELARGLVATRRGSAARIPLSRQLPRVDVASIRVVVASGLMVKF